MTISADRFRHTMSHLAGGVTVVVVQDADGRAWGMTASAVASLSLDPPMLLVCVDRAAAIHPLVAAAATFGISVLGEPQADIARRFAERERHRYDDHDGPRSPAGLPLVPGAIAHIELARGPVYDGGDHSIVTGTVAWAETPGGAPLCYFRSGYTGLVR